MSAGWVAGNVRARAMSRRRIGSAAVHALARHHDLGEATAALARTSYGHDVRAGQDLDTAQRAVVASVLWNLRVLAGWQPLRGVATMRLLFGAVERSNVLAHLEAMLGAEPRAPYQLGALGTAWSRVSRTSTPEGVRQVLAASVWGDPGGTTPREVALGMRAQLADRVVGLLPDAAAWAAGDTALLVARETILQDRDLPAQARIAAGRVLGPAALSARTLPELRAAVPANARWALATVEDPADLWRGEARWWLRVARDGSAMIRASRFGEPILLGATALLAVDAWRVRAALEVAARGGESGVLDEVG
jgi:hypothetical protein